MSLEACMIIIDNSAYCINGDYTPSRFLAQQDAATVVFNAKTNSNPETTVGLMTMAGTAPTVLATPTQELGKIMSALHGIPKQGDIDLVTAISVAQLALKHRQNKNQRQRIVAFVGSPLPSTAAPHLVKLGKKMKKNNVAIDIVSFGEHEQNQEALQAFIDSVNSSDNSNLVTAPKDPSLLLSDIIIASPVLGGNGQPSGSRGADDDPFAVDPNLDPELAMALRMSLEEERARQAAASGSAQPSEPMPTINESQAAPPQDVTMSTREEPATPTPASRNTEAPVQAMDQSMDQDEDADLALALALSKGEDADMDGDEDMEDEEAAVARALALSLQQSEEEADKKQ